MPFEYNKSLNQVSLDQTDAGHELSEVEVYYCLPTAPAPVISGLQALRISFYSADIVWTTDQPTTSKITVTRVNDNSQFVINDTTLGNDHTQSLTGLVTKSAYSVSVEATNPDGTSSTKIVQFNTLDDAILNF